MLCCCCSCFFFSFFLCVCVLFLVVVNIVGIVSSPVSRPALRFKDVCKRDLKLTDINTGSWESLAEDRSGWRQAVQAGVRRGEEKQTDGREKNEEETETGFRPSDPIHLQQLWQRLSCQDWTPEPLQPLLSTSLKTNQGAYHCFSRQTVAYHY